MNTDFSLTSTSMCIWRVFLPAFMTLADSFSLILTPDEIARANRFKFDNHRRYFIISRYFLRRILALYTHLSADRIELIYNEHGKPFLKNNSRMIDFNVSHSHDMAVYGLVLENQIGIDIEKIKADCNLDIAKRFFTSNEYQFLLAQPDHLRCNAFYAIWARKEAIIKALGKGLLTPLNSFSTVDQTRVSIHDEHKTIDLYIQPLSIHSDYAGAVATTHVIHEITHWEWLRQGTSIEAIPIEVG